jgi:hypothetical protein
MVRAELGAFSRLIGPRSWPPRGAALGGERGTPIAIRGMTPFMTLVRE